MGRLGSRQLYFRKDKNVKVRVWCEELNVDIFEA